eukprot:2824304-Amphidinium_carterae.1
MSLGIPDLLATASIHIAKEPIDRHDGVDGPRPLSLQGISLCTTTGRNGICDASSALWLSEAQIAL